MAFAAVALGATARRTGSYPLMNLADDFGVDYGDVLILSDAVGGRFQALSEDRKRQVRGASQRIWMRLGDGTSYALYGRMKRCLQRSKSA